MGEFWKKMQMNGSEVHTLPGHVDLLFNLAFDLYYLDDLIS